MIMEYVERYADVLYKEPGEGIVMGVHTMLVHDDDTAQDIRDFLQRAGMPWTVRDILDIDFFTTNQRGHTSKRRFKWG